ncbi:glutaminase A [Serinibacter arcticus]|uniref:Glutaminase n=1 Tax=Serinibacter arcticus TaxID=1655435 RepID=A0A2U1ZUZ5_9MICO|nr:glutaminase A [Serinibacter arcticus]PWD50798.1 glutaminase A [Serinibacter arcticus]
MKIAYDRVAATPRTVVPAALPSGESVTSFLTQVHEEFAADDDGELSTVAPALGRADPAHFGLAVLGVDGQLHEHGDSRVTFTIQSVVKPFTYALLAEELGVDLLRERVGVNATGLPFHSAQAVEVGIAGPTNPLVNAGAIATVSHIPGEGVEERWRWVRDGLSRFAGRDLGLDEETLDSEREVSHRNLALAHLMRSFGTVEGDPDDAVEIYTRTCALEVTAADLAVMGAVLADGGHHPVTGERVVSEEVARVTLALMLVAGMYESSGEWLIDVGMPAKSGIGGGIVTVSPGRCALGTYSPLLDGTGNSVRGALSAAMLSRSLGLDLLASEPYA